MKQDKLKQFINSNKDQFESDFDLNRNWKQIESKISNRKKSTMNPSWIVAASFVILLSIGWLIYDRAILTDKINQLKELTYNNKPYSEIENYYRTNISQKTTQISEISKKNDLKVNIDLKSLNKKYEDLKEQIKKQGAHPQLVNAMIQNLQIQIEILEQQKQILQDLQEYKLNRKLEHNETSI